jgi:energy-coupling factor transporter ATP-binding protein EcfA2
VGPVNENSSQLRPAGPPALKVAGASFSYGREPALADVTFELWPGEAVALIGPNGSGKSTLLKGVLGLIQRVGGTVEVLGHSPAPAGAIGYVPQTDDLDPQFPVTLEQVVMMGRYRSLGRRIMTTCSRVTGRPSPGRWRPSAWRTGRRAASASSPAGSRSAVSWRAPWHPAPACCSSTSRSTAWTRRTATP